MTELIVGIDEVGTGALAGPVVVCAYAADAYPPEVRDSKKMTTLQREAVYERLLRQSTFLHLVMAPAGQVRDRNLGPVWHTLTSSCVRAASNAGAVDIIIDGNRGVRSRFRHRVLPKADTLIPAVSAASVVAKVFRDKLMAKLALTHRGYGWAKNVGYGTKQHKLAIERLGATEEHRYERHEERRAPYQPLLPIPASSPRHPDG